MKKLLAIISALVTGGLGVIVVGAQSAVNYAPKLGDYKK